MCKCSSNSDACVWMWKLWSNKHIPKGIVHSSRNKTHNLTYFFSNLLAVKIVHFVNQLLKKISSKRLMSFSNLWSNVKTFCCLLQTLCCESHFLEAKLKICRCWQCVQVSVCVCCVLWEPRYSSVLSHGQSRSEHWAWGSMAGLRAREKKIKPLGFRQGEKSEIRWCDENGRKAARGNTRSFKPQKLFRATNSFYKAGSALIPVISKTEGRRMSGKSTCLWKICCKYCYCL